MPTSSDFEDFRVCPRGVLFDAGQLITEIAENPSGNLIAKQRENRHVFADRGESIYTHLGFQGIATLSDKKVGERLESAFQTLRDIRRNDGDRISRSHKRRIDSACNAILTRISWLDNGIQCIQSHTETGLDFIRMTNGDEIEYDPAKHAYLKTAPVRQAFTQEGVKEGERVAAAAEPTEEKGIAAKPRRRTRKPKNQPK